MKFLATLVALAVTAAAATAGCTINTIPVGGVGASFSYAQQAPPQYDVGALCQAALGQQLYLPQQAPVYVQQAPLYLQRALMYVQRAPVYIPRQQQVLLAPQGYGYSAPRAIPVPVGVPVPVPVHQGFAGGFGGGGGGFANTITALGNAVTQVANSPAGSFFLGAQAAKGKFPFK